MQQVIIKINSPTAVERTVFTANDQQELTFLETSIENLPNNKIRPEKSSLIKFIKKHLA